VDEQTDLPVQFGGDLGQRPGGLPADDLVGRDLFLGETL